MQVHPMGDTKNRTLSPLIHTSFFLKGIIHNTTAAETKFTKVSAASAQWQKHIFTNTDAVGSLDHCATWCLVHTKTCHLFAFDNGWCYMGTTDQTTVISGS
jgi:hypothetical protein